MGGQVTFPQTSKEVLAVITEAERSRKYVWTAGRVLIQGAFQGAWEELTPKAKKELLRKITSFLEELAGDGALLSRPILQSIGYGEEKGFDYIRPTRRSN
jgi:hypothetical protein